MVDIQFEPNIIYTGLLKIGTRCFAFKSGLLRFRETGPIQKIGTFTEIRYTCESLF